MGRKLLLIWGSDQRTSPATHWHDGQITCRVENGVKRNFLVSLAVVARPGRCRLVIAERASTATLIFEGKALRSCIGKLRHFYPSHARACRGHPRLAFFLWRQRRGWPGHLARRRAEPVIGRARARQPVAAKRASAPAVIANELLSTLRNFYPRHARTCSGHPRLRSRSRKVSKAWMAATSSAKTRFELLRGHDGKVRAEGAHRKTFHLKKTAGPKPRSSFFVEAFAEISAAAEARSAATGWQAIAQTSQSIDGSTAPGCWPLPRWRLRASDCPSRSATR